MKNLGKILLIIFIFPYTIFASVDASVDARNVTLGDSVTLRLNVSGKNVQKPNLATVCDSDILSSGSQTSIQMINGNYSKSYILSYTFEPTHDCEIKPIAVNIDGKKELSNPIKIHVSKNPIKMQNADFSLNLSASKSDVYVGEPFDVTLVLKQRRDASAVDSQFIEPKLDGFWIKNKTNPVRSRDSKYVITKVKYTMAAQREGNLTISPAKIKIATRVNSRDMWGMFGASVKWKSYFSNSIKIHSKPLPSGVNLVGNFTLGVKVDKQTINKNEALNLTISVQGDGNLEDIKSFKPYIDGVNVFAEKINIDNKAKILTQKLAFVSDSDFTIPSFELKYFDPLSKTVKIIKTKPIKIKVNGALASKEKPLVIKKANSKVQEPINKVKKVVIYSKSWTIASFIFGLIVGMLIMFFRPWKFISISKEKSINIKDEKALLIKLFPFRDDIEVQKIVDILERNIYSNANIKIDKRILKEIIKKYNI